jgi:DNA-binding transcriptional ArsR family regulator
MKEELIFRALADPARRQILSNLSHRDGQTLYEICVRLLVRKKFDMSRQAISKHLAVLEEASLITTQWDGREKLHFLSREPLKQIQRWMQSLD